MTLWVIKSISWLRVLRSGVEIKMIKLSMFKQQTLTKNKDELDHIMTKALRVLRLNAQYENHPYVR